MAYNIQVDPSVLAFMQDLDEKSRRVCKTHLAKLGEGPYLGRGAGNKERLMVRGQDVYRLHISRRFTAFYVIVEPDVVRVIELMGIKEAHKKYGWK